MTETAPALKRRPSLHDIARSAEVSVSTVSRYLNGQLTLRRETEARVISAIEELGYTPSTPVSRETRSPAIGLIVPQIGNPYFGRLADSVVSASEAHGLSVLIGSTLNHSRKQLEYVDMLAATDVEGLVYAGNYSTNNSLSALIERGLPVVVVDEAMIGTPPVDTVRVDDYAGAFQVMTYLTSLGHKSIALVTGPSNLQSVQERTRAYRDGLQRAGIEPREDRILSGAFNPEFGATALSHILSWRDRPTAVFAASDTIAIGMMLAAETHGVSVPGDLSIVGFDDVPDAVQVRPRLTTVKTPLERMASVAVSLLVDRIDDPSRAANHVTVGVSLEVRDSAAPPA